MKNNLIMLLALALTSCLLNAKSIESGKREVKLQQCPKMTDMGTVSNVYTEQGYNKGFAKTTLSGCFKEDGNVSIEYQTVFPSSIH